MSPATQIVAPAEQPLLSQLRRAAAKDFLKGAVWIAVLLGLQIAGEDTLTVRTLKLAAYDAIQLRLRPHPPDVVVVNIANLPHIYHWAGNRDLTDRQRLGEVIARIAEAKPAAIGVDLDFSPDYDILDPEHSRPTYHAPDQQDPQLFDLCTRLSKHGVPVFLGVSESSARPRAEMLVRPEYAALAADIHANLLDTHVMPERFLWRPDGPAVSTLSADLARAVHSAQPRMPWLLGWAIEAEHDSPLARGGKVRQFLVDYSNIDDLYAQRIDFIDATGEIDSEELASCKGRITGRVVLLGGADPDHPRDRWFTVAGRRAAYPGVFIHAAATQTLIDGPLYNVTTAGRAALDVLLAGTVLSVVVLIQHRRRRCVCEGAEHAEWIPFLATVATALLAMVFATYFVSRTRVIWDDYFVVIGVMVLHLPAEKLTGGLTHGITWCGQGCSHLSQPLLRLIRRGA